MLTHWHWDHCFGLSALSAISLCSSKTQEKLREMSAWGWSEEQMQKRLQTGQEIAFCHENILKEYPDRRHICVRAAELSFSGELSIDLGGRTARLLPLSNSHAEGSLAVFVPEERALLLGDIICPDYYGSMPPRHCPKKLAQLIAQLNALDFDTVLYGHGEPAQVCKAELLADLPECTGRSSARLKERSRRWKLGIATKADIASLVALRLEYLRADYSVLPKEVEQVLRASSPSISPGTWERTAMFTWRKNIKARLAASF